jgi:hypothetical protein
VLEEKNMKAKLCMTSILEAQIRELTSEEDLFLWLLSGE